jgi:hypothetical protein
MGRWRRWWHWTTLYSYRVVLHDAELKTWLCPRIKGQDWTVVSNNGVDLQKWFKAHGKGLMRYTAHGKEYPGGVGGYRSLLNYQAPLVEIGFTDLNTALMCKLTLGGR